MHSMYCSLLAHQWKEWLSSTSVLGGTPDPKNLAWNHQETLSKQKNCAKINHASLKQTSFISFVCKLTEFTNQMFGDFEKITLAQVIRYEIGLESSLYNIVSQGDLNRVTENRDSSRFIDPSHAITGRYCTSPMWAWLSTKPNTK